MSRQPSTALIGSFVIGAVCLAIAGLMFFGAWRFSKDSRKYVLFFDESVNGLEVGGRVKYRGVPIGTVYRILIRLPGQPDGSAHVPVIVNINTDTLRDLGAAKFGAHGEDSLDQAVERGLRAQLRLESLITGLYYVEVDFQDASQPPVFIQAEQAAEYPEIPTTPSAFAALGQSLDQIIVAIGSAGIDKLVGDAVEIIDQINIKLIEFDVIEISVKITDALDAIEARFNDRRLDDAVEKLNVNLDLLNARMSDRRIDDAIAGLNTTLEAIRARIADPTLDKAVAEAEASLRGLNALIGQANTEFRPVVGDIRDVIGDAQRAVNGFQRTLEQLGNTNDTVQELISPESTVRYRLERALSEFASAAEAMRNLAEMLERHPQSLLTGKAGSQ